MTITVLDILKALFVVAAIAAVVVLATNGGAFAAKYQRSR